MGWARGSEAFCGEDRGLRRLFWIADITVMRQNHWKLQCGAMVERTWKTQVGLPSMYSMSGKGLYEKIM